MLIRITYHDKVLNRPQPAEYKAVSTPLASDPKACYTDRKTQVRILGGSI
jgi:hypothetical protein